MQRQHLVTAATLFFATLASAATSPDAPVPASKQPTRPSEAARFYGVTPIAPPWLQRDPGPQYWSQARKWQGIPSIERSPNGRLWATWYAGPHIEGGDGNYAVLVTSDDDGKTWTEPVAVFHPFGFFESKALDPLLWTDPDGNLWWINHRLTPIEGADPLQLRSAWAFKADNPEKTFPRWSRPVFIAHGVCLNKPTVLANGDWLRPVVASREDPARIQIYISRDKGKTWQFLSKHTPGQAPEIAKTYCESMLIERRDGSLWMLFRSKNSIKQIESFDSGKSWQNESDFSTERGIDTRFFITRLQSGKLLLVINDHPKARANLTAMLSDDDGKTWPHKLVLDERNPVSYPDGVQAPDGSIYVIYDHGRYHKDAQQILFAKFTEEDVLAGRTVNAASRLKQNINRLADTGGGVKTSNEASRFIKENKERKAATRETN
ncbi:sialidase family protein [Geminisphaera colitermitum]|uniref:sialidase family protein n=1 Tax=Geminisphaera colitermitum TaxID=1148786 RepID=UPI000158C73E|nr:sialidase family protein [Geminisphaera colitermitum]